MGAATAEISQEEKRRGYIIALVSHAIRRGLMKTGLVRVHNLACGERDGAVTVYGVAAGGRIAIRFTDPMCKNLEPVEHTGDGFESMSQFDRFMLTRDVREVVTTANKLLDQMEADGADIEAEVLTLHRRSGSRRRSSRSEVEFDTGPLKAELNRQGEIARRAILGRWSSSRN